MRLSMHMIANRICFLDMETFLNEEDPPVLKGARLVHATDCAYLYAEGNDTICSAQSGTIRLKDVQLTEGVAIIQSVFEFYDDWHTNIQGLIAQRDYQNLVDSCFRVFHNPMIIQDTDCKVLGMSSHYGEHEVNREWAHLYRYGYSSMQALDYVKSGHPEYEFGHENILPFQFQGAVLNSRGITGDLMFQNEFFLRITVLEQDRPLNEGDGQLLAFLLELMQRHLARTQGERDKNADNSVLYALLNREETDPEKLDRRLLYAGWAREDSYQVVLVRSRKRELFPRGAEIMRSTLKGIFPESRVVGRELEFILIWNISKSGDFKRERVQQVFAQTEADVGISLPMGGIFQLPWLYDQARAAVDNQAFSGEGGDRIRDFYDMGRDYILMSGSLEEMIRACHPDVRRLWEREQQEGDGLFDIFAAYLKYERSILKTSQALYIHRNTLLYRIKKIRKLLEYDLEEDDARHYMQLSVMVVELYRRKQGVGGVWKE